MGWKLLDKPKTVKVTKKLAQQFAEMDSAPHDRPLSERRLAVYSRVLKEGGFRPVSWASALCVETGGVYRVNGKHTSTLLAGLKDIPEFYAVIEDYECDTLDDVARLYATFDSSTQSRTARDIYLSFASTVPELREVPVNHITGCVAGMSMHLANGEHRGQPLNTAADRAELLLDHAEFVVWASSVLTAGDGSKRGADGRRIADHIRRQPVIAAMMGTWQKAKGAATEFWSAVRDETGAKPDLPDRKLARYLHTTALGSGRANGRIKPANPREMYVKCLHAWNAWRKGENTNLQYYAEADVPSIK